MKWMLYVSALMILCFATGCSDSDSSADPTTSTEVAKPQASREPPQIQRIAYREVERWPVPSGGFGRAIVIDDSLATEADLRSLGDQIREEFRNDHNSFVFVYDDERAARMRGRYNLPIEDGNFYNRHSVGTYTKNGTNGFHEWTITPQGIEGPMIQVNY